MPTRTDRPSPAHGELRQTVWQGLLWTVSGGASLALIQTFTLVFLARLLTPTDFGLLTASLVVVNLSKIFVFLGIGPAIVQLPSLSSRHMSAGLAVSLAFSVLVQAIVWISAPAISRFFGDPQLISMLRAISFVFPLRGLCVVSQSLLLRRMAFKRLTQIEVISSVGFTLVALTLALLGFGAWALILAYIANAVVETVLSVLASPPERPTSWRRRELSDLLRFGSGITIARVAAYGALNADNLVVGRFLGLTALGFYGRAYGMMAATVTLTGGVIDKVFFPAIASIQTEMKRLQSGFRDGQTAIVLGVLPISGLLVILAPEIVLLVLGSQWIAVIPAFRVLAAGLLFRTGYRIAMSMTRGTGAVYRLAGNQLIYTVAVFLGAIVGQRWGIEGVAVGILGAMGVGYLVAAQTALRIVSLSWTDFARMHLQGAMLAGAVAAAGWLVASGLRWIDARAILVVLGSGLVSGVVFILGSRGTVKRLSGVDVVGEVWGFIANRAALVR